MHITNSYRQSRVSTSNRRQRGNLVYWPHLFSLDLPHWGYTVGLIERHYPSSTLVFLILPHFGGVTWRFYCFLMIQFPKLQQAPSDSGVCVSVRFGTALIIRVCFNHPFISFELSFSKIFQEIIFEFGIFSQGKSTCPHS